ncbi:Glucose-induced degradation protein 8 -like protein [Halotydeus destructor]|nr:Glucose-induced degradation protein 8 -like protein [Halotydeus destructor]
MAASNIIQDRLRDIFALSEARQNSNWMEQLNSIQLKRSQMNKLVMDYLVAEGFKEAAERFKCEAGVDMNRIGGPELNEDAESLDHRIEIRTSIEDGRLVEAIKLVNKYFPELLDNKRPLYFKLQQQQLIELIRQQQVEEALTFAQEQLSVDEDYLHLQELERTLALLAFEHPEDSPYSDLLHLSHRQQLASEINEAILMEISGSVDETKPQLVTLMKLLLWTQTELERKKVKFPKITDLSAAKISGSTPSE